MAEKTKIDREDIRVGDKILAVVDRDDVLTTTEGVVHTFAYLDGLVPTSEAGWAIGSNTRPTQYFLVERPKEEIKLPEVGTWVRFTTYDDPEPQIGQVTTYGIVETVDEGFEKDGITSLQEVQWVTV